MTIQQISLFEDIEANFDIQQGKPIICNTAITVETILSLLQVGKTFNEIIGNFPNLSTNHVKNVVDFLTHLVVLGSHEEGSQDTLLASKILSLVLITGNKWEEIKEINNKVSDPLIQQIYERSRQALSNLTVNIQKKFNPSD